MMNQLPSKRRYGFWKENRMREEKKNRNRRLKNIGWVGLIALAITLAFCLGLLWDYFGLGYQII